MTDAKRLPLIGRILTFVLAALIVSCGGSSKPPGVTALGVTVVRGNALAQTTVEALPTVAFPTAAPTVIATTAAATIPPAQPTAPQAPTAQPTVAAPVVPTSTPRPVVANTVTAVPVIALSVTSLTSPIGRGQTARLSAKTSPSATCSISYSTPAGTISEAAGLTSKAADGTGAVSWSWLISPGTNPSPPVGHVSVVCAGQTANVDIVIQ